MKNIKKILNKLRDSPCFWRGQFIIIKIQFFPT